MLAATLSGCVAQSDDGRGSSAVVADNPGWLLVNFTIDGASNPERCDELRASVIGVKVTSADGKPAGEFHQACPAFYSTITLAPGRYSADAVLLDGAGSTCSNAVTLHQLDVESGIPLEVPIDFATQPLYVPSALETASDAL